MMEQRLFEVVCDGIVYSGPCPLEAARTIAAELRASTRRMPDYNPIYVVVPVNPENQESDQ